MPKIKEFHIKESYVANYGHGDRCSETRFSVPVSNYNDLKQQLKNQIRDPESLQKVLQSEFIYAGSLGVRSHDSYNTFAKERYRRIPSFSRYSYSDPHSSHRNFERFEDSYIENPNYGCGQRDTSWFAKYKVAPFLEELVVNHPEDFRALLAEADEVGKKNLLNFTNLDLSDADLTHLDLSLVNFSGCDLRKTKGITQELLDSSLTYLNAQLPEGMIPFWSNDKKNAVLAHVKQLSLYGEKLLLSPSKEGKIKGQLAQTLGAQLTYKIKHTAKFNGSFQKELLDLLQQHHNIFAHKRYHGLKMIISNLILCILGFGVGYLAAGIVHQHQRGRFLFFQRTTTEQRIADIQDSMGKRSAFA